MPLKKWGFFGKQRTITQPADLDLLKEMQRIGFQPFIMLRINEGMGRRSHVVCATQNEAPQFVHDLVACGITVQHCVLFAVDKALRLEADAAAIALGSWITNSDSHYRLLVLRGVSAFDWTWSAFYVGYPGLDIDFLEKARDSADAKFDAAREFVMGYLETAGNDSLRAALVEGFALGLARAARKVAREEEMLALVNRARELQQQSLALEGASRALALTVDGKPVPEELSQFLKSAKS